MLKQKPSLGWVFYCLNRLMENILNGGRADIQRLNYKLDTVAFKLWFNLQVHHYLSVAVLFQ